LLLRPFSVRFIWDHHDPSPELFDLTFGMQKEALLLGDEAGQVAERGLTPFVTFTGQVPYEEVAEYLSRADIGVAPDPKTPMNDKSTHDHNYGVHGCRLPVVLFDLNEGRRIAGSAALCASRNDLVASANQIRKLLNCDELSRELAKSGGRRMEHRLNCEVEKRALLVAYESALQ
jgi:glycosyltransferase involved in cell wall biosynthesis